jgi:hypothetical protein
MSAIDLLEGEHHQRLINTAQGKRIDGGTGVLPLGGSVSRVSMVVPVGGGVKNWSTTWPSNI